MRVLWIDLVSELGGAQHSLLEVCGGLSACGVEAVAAVPRGPLFDRLAAAGLTVRPVSPLRASRRGWGFLATALKLLRAPPDVGRLIRAVQPAVIHANSLPAFLVARKAAPAIPVVWHVRDLRMPAVLACDAARKAARIIAASEAVDGFLVDLLPPDVLGRIRVIRNGIDPARFLPSGKAAARQRFGLPPAVPVIGMVAHLIPWKRHDAFIDAAAAIRRQRPDACFVIAGRDLFNEHARWIARLKKKIAQAGLQNAVRWIADCDDTALLLPAFDLLLHPALGEPFGRVICEAMSSSVPVIASESGGPASIIESGVSGILIRDGDPQRMAEATLTLLADPARAAALAAAARARILNHFTVDKVCGQLAKEYRALTRRTTLL